MDSLIVTFTTIQPKIVWNMTVKVTFNIVLEGQRYSCSTSARYWLYS
jgi:hypothetical protein